MKVFILPKHLMPEYQKFIAEHPTPPANKTYLQWFKETKGLTIHSTQKKLFDYEEET